MQCENATSSKAFYKPGPFGGGERTPPLPGFGGETDTPVVAALALYAARVLGPSKFWLTTIAMPIWQWLPFVWLQ